MDLQAYPEITDSLDDSGTMDTSAELTSDHLGKKLLIVRQTSDAEGDTQIFKEENGSWVLQEPAGSRPYSQKVGAQPSSNEDHNAIFSHVIELLEPGGSGYSSSNGPDNGNLACLWLVRHIIHDAINRMITDLDGTEEFGQELSSSFSQKHTLQDARDGWIIISPTKSSSRKRNIGHVGILGVPSGDQTLIYSNSSKKKQLQQNFDLAKWKSHYQDKKGLDVLFYPVPDYSAALNLG